MMGTIRAKGLYMRARQVFGCAAIVALSAFVAIGALSPRPALAEASLLERIQERAKLRVTDNELQTSVPAALVSYRTLVRTYPNADGNEVALEEMADLYDDLRRYDLAAETLQDMATRFPNNTRDAAWRAGELYEKRVKDAEKARKAYMMVPMTSSRYRDAQKKLQK